MKHISLFILLLSVNSFVRAQKPDSAAVKTAKTRNLDGTMMSSGNDLMTNLSASPEFTVVVKLINAAGLADSLKARTVTFLAPANKAFDKLPPGAIDTLLVAAHKTDLVSFINSLTIPEKLTSQDINRQIKAGNGKATLTTASGTTLTASINENRNIVLTDKNGEQNIVTRFNIEQSNGMLFVISNVLLPAKKQ